MAGSQSIDVPSVVALDIADVTDAGSVVRVALGSPFERKVAHQAVRHVAGCARDDRVTDVCR